MLEVKIAHLQHGPVVRFLTYAHLCSSDFWCPPKSSFESWTTCTLPCTFAAVCICGVFSICHVLFVLWACWRWFLFLCFVMFCFFHFHYCPPCARYVLSGIHCQRFAVCVFPQLQCFWSSLLPNNITHVIILFTESWLTETQLHLYIIINRKLSPVRQILSMINDRNFINIQYT